MKQLLTLFITIACFKVYSQHPIFVSSGSKLYTLDLNNCKKHYVGNDGLGSGDIAFTPDGRLWGIGNDSLYQIDTANGNTVVIGKTEFGWDISLEGLNDTTLLVVTSGYKLFGIRTKDATSYYIGSIGYQAAGDMTWYDNALYMTAFGSKLIKIVLNNSNSAILSVSVIKNQIPSSCFAVTNVDFLDSFYSIVGFSGSAAYKICHIDGTYIKICSSIGAFDGAATIRLPIQKPEPTSCQLTTNKIDKLNSKKSIIEIFPNPASKTGRLQIKLNDVSLPCEISIVSLQGVTLFSQIEQSNTSVSFDLDKIVLSSGFYFIVITSKSNKFYSIMAVD